MAIAWPPLCCYATSLMPLPNQQTLPSVDGVTDVMLAMLQSAQHHWLLIHNAHCYRHGKGVVQGFLTELQQV